MSDGSVCCVRQEGRQICSPQDNAELFAATIGGVGLTGIIEWAEIKLLPIRSSQIDGTVERFETLAEFFALSAELDHEHEYGVAWIDCAATGRTIGRGVYLAGNFAPDDTLEVATSATLGIPLTPPVSLVNGLSLRVFNEVYWRKHSRDRQSQRLGYAPFFYPLDSIRQLEPHLRSKGFQQYQCLIPQAPAETRNACFTERHRRSREPAPSSPSSSAAARSRLAGLLSFPAPGTTLALDFPHSKRLDTTLFPRLDAIVREAGGRLYPAKDAHMAAKTSAAAIRWEQLEALRDPALCSRFWTRVTT